MGFIYTKPLSVEEVFGKFDTDHDGRISKDEAKAAKNMDVFTSFKVKKDMTLEKFEAKNLNVYSKYESYATLAYNKQQENVQKWMKKYDSMFALNKEREVNKLDEIEMELEEEKQRLEEELANKYNNFKKQ